MFFRHEVNIVKLDAIDRRILACLQEDNQISNLALAERVGLSPPACLKRVRALREAKVIIGDMSIVDPKALGQLVTVVVEVTLARASLDVVDGFKRKMVGQPEVSQCYLVTGASDIVLIVQVADMEAYESFLTRVLYSDAAVATVSSLVVVNRIKFQPRVVVDGSGP